MRRAALAALAATAVAVAVIAIRSGGDDSSVVRAEFTTVAGLVEGSQVRVEGADVGSVRSLRVEPPTTAAVELEVADEALPIGEGASATIRSANLLGEKFVELDVGDRARPLPEQMIPLEATAAPVELDDVIDVLDSPTRTALGLLIGESGIALERRGEDLETVLERLPPSVRDTRLLIDEVTADTRALGLLLEEAERVSAAVARERSSLGRLVDTGVGALETAAAKHDQLGETTAATPGLLAQLRASLARLDRAGAALRPAARGLEATAPPLEATLRALVGFDVAAAPALGALTGASPALRRLGHRGTPVIRRLRPVASTLRNLAADQGRLLTRLDASVADILAVTENWARVIQTRDGVGHVYRNSVSLSPDLLRQIDAYIAGDAAQGARRRQRVEGARARGPGADASQPSDRSDGALGELLGDGVDDALDELRRTTERIGRRTSTRSLDPLLDLLLGP